MIFFLIFLVITSKTYALSPKEMLEKIDEIRAPAKTFSFDLKITYKREGEKDIEQRLEVRIKESDKSLVKFTAPPENKGKLFLMIGNNMWIYIPGTREPIRISPQQRLLGQVSNGDVARVVYSLDYEAKLLEEEKLKGTPWVKLELNAKTLQATYSKIILWAEAETLKPQKAEFYAVSGKLLKIAFYKGYTKVLDRERPLILEIYDQVRQGEHTIIEYNQMKVVDTPAAFFQKTYLKHIR